MDHRSIIAARGQLDPEIICTPVHPWRHAGTLLGIPVQLKLESLQRTGSFKPRGAWCKLRSLSDKERAQGVICASAGNHAQGVAFAARRLGVHATIVMPQSAPCVKVSQTRACGDPEIILAGRDLAEAIERATQLVEERGLTYIHPYDDAAVITGQGTVGLEILEQCPEVDTIIVPVGGGGLLAGLAVAVRAVRPDVRIIGVQAKQADAVARSLEAGAPVTLDTASTIADGIRVRVAGHLPLQILTSLQVPVTRVTDVEIRAAMIALGQTARLVVEPAGAASAAVVLFRRELLADSRHIVAVISGANVNLCCYAKIIRSFPVQATADVGLACLTCTGEEEDSCLGSLAPSPSRR